MTSEPRTLVCASMRNGPCDGEVTKLDAKGYIYCTSCGTRRRMTTAVRRLTKAEIATLRAGGTVKRY